jgi:hypothetical protein
MFNTLKYAKMLEEVGFSKDQAETSITILVEIMEDKLATKQDLQTLQTRIENDFQQLKSDLAHTLSQMESKLTIRMGTMLAASIAILTAIQKLT